jgi:hypothetical protein
MLTHSDFDLSNVYQTAYRRDPRTLVRRCYEPSGRMTSDLVDDIRHEEQRNYLLIGGPSLGALSRARHEGENTLKYSTKVA